MNTPVRLKDTFGCIYDNMLKILDSFGQSNRFATKDKYVEAKHIITNNLYLIYERIYLNVVRDINYTDVRNFATNNNDFVKYIFSKHFPDFSIEHLDSWTRINVGIIECAMFRSGRHDKHVYH